MRKDDARKLDHATLEALRIRAVGMVQKGESPEVVGKALGLNRTTVYEWLAMYRRGGWDALKAKPVPGRKPKLSGRTNEMGFRYSHPEKPDAAQVRVRLVDARDGGGGHQGEIRDQAGGKLGWAFAGAIGYHLTEAPTSSHRA